MSTRPLRILLVDDDDCALLGIAVEMADLNLRLQTVTDGGQAIEYLEGRGAYADRSTHPLPDLLVLDLDTRLTRALDFLGWRRASALFSSLPVVLFSAFAHKGAVDSALAMGANTFVAKPLEFGCWDAAVRRLWDLGMERSELVA